MDEQTLADLNSAYRRLYAECCLVQTSYIVIKRINFSLFAI